MAAEEEGHRIQVAEMEHRIVLEEERHTVLEEELRKAVVEGRHRAADRERHMAVVGIDLEEEHRRAVGEDSLVEEGRRKAVEEGSLAEGEDIGHSLAAGNLRVRVSLWPMRDVHRRVLTSRRRSAVWRLLISTLIVCHCI